MRYRIYYSRFSGQHETTDFDTLTRAKIALRDEIREMRAFQGPHGAPWRRVSVAEAFPHTSIDEKNRIFEPYTHVSWDPSKPEKVWIERVVG